MSREIQINLGAFNGTVWMHRKSSKTYYAKGTVINSTNKNDGQVMVHYTNGNQQFVREVNEFLEKFRRF